MRGKYHKSVVRTRPKEILQIIYGLLMNYINELDKLEDKRNRQKIRGEDMKKWIWLLIAFAFLSAYLILTIGNFHLVSDAAMLIIFGFAIIASARYGRQFLRRKI
jgi:hypothetical protein